MKRLLCFFLCALLVMGNMNLTVLAEGMGQNAEVEDTTEDVSEEMTDESESTTEDSAEESEESDTEEESFSEECEDVSEETTEEEMGESTSEEEMADEEVSEEATEESETESSEEESAWDGVTKEKVYETENCNITFLLTNVWETGYQAEVILDNTGEHTIENWTLSFLYKGEIADLWNAEIAEHQDNRYVVKYMDYNRDVIKGAPVTFGLCANESFSGFPEEMEMIQTEEPTPDEDYTVELQVNSEWVSGFVGAVFITNNTDVKLEDWKLAFSFDREIYEIWNAQLLEQDGNRYLVANAGYNAVIAPHETVTFGIRGGAGNGSEKPYDCVLTRFTLEKPGEVVDKTMESVDFLLEPEFNGVDTYESVTENIILPTEMQGATIKWTSSHPAINAENGIVTRPEEESVWVTLKAEITYGEEKEEKEFKLKVVKNYYSDYSTDYIEVYDDYEYLYEFNDGDSEECLSIYENEAGYMDFLLGSYTNMVVECSDEAILSLYHVKELLGMTDPKSELTIKAIASDNAVVCFRMQQMYEGIPVFGREVSVVTNHDGRTVTLNSGYFAGINISTTPSLAAEEAGNKLVMEGYADVREEDLCIYVFENEPKLAWVFYGADVNGDTYRFIVSATDGQILDKETTAMSVMVGGGPGLEGYSVSLQDRAGNIKYYLVDETRNIYVIDFKGLEKIVPVDFGYAYSKFENMWLEQSDKKVKQLKAALVYSNVVDCYNYFYKFGRKGCDGANGKIGVFFDISMPADNSFYDYDNGFDRIKIGINQSESSDVLVHEYTHGVVRAETGLGATGIQGTINEAYADIFGQLSQDNPDWISGNESADQSSWRDLRNPNKYGYPSKVEGEFFGKKDDEKAAQGDSRYLAELEEGFAHRNSTILSHAFHKMYARGVNKETLGRILYTSLEIGYDKTPADYGDVRKAVLAAAVNQHATAAQLEAIREAFDEANIPDEKVDTSEGTNTVIGTIVVADMNNELHDNSFLGDVEVSLERERALKSKTDKSGEFYFNEILPGKYTLKAKKEGYLPVRMQVDVTGRRNDHYCEVIEMIPEEYKGEGRASGQIVDAVTGKGVKGLTLQIRKGMNFEEGTIIKTLITDENGFYETGELDAGHYCISIIDNDESREEKYVFSKFNIKVLGGTLIGNQNASVSTKLSKGELRIVLEWGARPYDLDSHLFGPGCHVYYKQRKYSSNGKLAAELDRDDTTSYGPETTTIYGTVEGEYLFTVHNYSGTPDMTVSDATVKVYFGNQQKPYKTYYIPKEKTGYRYWKVFKYNTKTRQITLINEMSNTNGF